MKRLLETGLLLLVACCVAFVPSSSQPNNVASVVDCECDNPICACEPCKGDDCACAPTVELTQVKHVAPAVVAPPDLPSEEKVTTLVTLHEPPPPGVIAVVHPPQVLPPKPAPKPQVLPVKQAAPKAAPVATGYYVTRRAGFRGRRSYQEWVPYAQPSGACNNGACAAPQAYRAAPVWYGGSCGPGGCRSCR